jgi:hypothetical protein
MTGEVQRGIFPFHWSWRKEVEEWGREGGESGGGSVSKGEERGSK